MSEHLPECTDDLRWMLNPGEWVDEDTGEAECVLCCMLRACEQRMAGCMCPAPNTDCEHPTCPRFVPEVRRQGFAAGVQAARDAVAALPYPRTFGDYKRDALAAIDALRGDSN